MRINRLARRKSFVPAAIIAFIFLIAAAGLSAIHFLGIPAVFGFSTAKILLAVPKPVREIGEGAVKSIIDLPYIKYYFQNKKIPTYYLAIDEKDLEKLNRALPGPEGNLSQSEKIKVPAKITIGGKEYDVEANYRGETSPHWLYPKKSWRIKFKKNNLFNGLCAVDLIIPEERGYAMALLNNSYRVAKLGIKSPFYDFVDLNINLENFGPYLLVAHWDKETLDKMGLDGNSDLYGENFINEPIFTDIKYWNKYTSDPSRPSDDYSDLERLIYLASEADQEEFERKIFGIIDKKNLFAWWTHQILAGSVHQDWAHNIRIYFNKDSGKFIFIPWDVGGELLRGRGLFINYNPILSRILQNETWRKQILSYLWAYVKDEKNIKDDLVYYDAITDKIKTSVFNDRRKEPLNSRAEADMKSLRLAVEDNFNFIKSSISDSGLNVSIQENYAGGVPLAINFETKGISPIELKKIKIQGARNFNVFADSNGDGQLNAGDAPIGYLPADGEMAISKTFMPGIKAQNENPQAYLPFDIIPARLQLFFTGAGVLGEEIKVGYSVGNIITGEISEI